MSAMRARRGRGPMAGAAPGGGAAGKSGPGDPGGPMRRIEALRKERARRAAQAAPPHPAKTFLAGSLLFLGVAAAGAAFLSGSLYDVGERVALAADEAAAAAGFEAKPETNADLAPQRAAAVRAAAMPEGRRSLFAVDPEDARARVESLDWVARAEVRRLWPSTVLILVEPRAQMARWRVGDEETAIDPAGERIHAAPTQADALLVEGRGAGPASPDILAALAGAPTTRARLERLERVGDRRWDAHFEGGVVVALPADDPAAAIAALERLQNDYAVLDRAIARIDLRAPDVVALQPAPDAAGTQQGDER